VSTVARAETKGIATELHFRGPLFSSGTRLTTDGRNEIRQIGNELRSASRVEILGLTDAKPLKASSKYRDNQELGLARAYAVAVLMHNEFGLPLTQMTLGSGKPLGATGGALAGRDRRTVVIRTWQGGS
jgi:flagellar motor protein MotB